LVGRHQLLENGSTALRHLQIVAKDEQDLRPTTGFQICQNGFEVAFHVEELVQHQVTVNSILVLSGKSR